MDPASMVIKIKGLSAINSLASGTPIVGVVKLKGGITAAKAATVKLGELEGGRLLATKKGLLLYGAELEHACLPGAKVAATKAAVAKAAVGKVALAKGASQGAVVGSKVALGSSAAMSAKSVGWSLGLGGLGPWLALGALGLAATGIYLYLRSQQPQDAFEEPDEFEAPA